MPGKIQVFEDRSSNLSIKKVKLEDRGVQTDPVAFQESTTTTSGNSILKCVEFPCHVDELLFS